MLKLVMRKESICAVDDCDKKVSGRGYCMTHYMRLKRTGRVDIPSFSERFWAKVDKSGECWEWTGYKLKQGYGKYTAYWSEGKQSTMAHRFAYEQTHGCRLAPDIELDHMCFNKACVNPDHLRLATSKQNKENRSGPQKNSSSGILGVCWNKKSKKWQASVRHNKYNYYLGLFDDLSSAETAVIAKRLELFTHNLLDRKAA